MIKYAKKAGPKTSLLNHIISLTIDFNAALQAGFSQSGILAGKPGTYVSFFFHFGKNIREGNSPVSDRLVAAKTAFNRVA